jgi:hypothetical protein
MINRSKLFSAQVALSPPLGSALHNGPSGFGDKVNGIGFVCHQDISDQKNQVYPDSSYLSSPFHGQNIADFSKIPDTCRNRVEDSVNRFNQGSHEIFQKSFTGSIDNTTTKFNPRGEYQSTFRSRSAGSMDSNSRPSCDQHSLIRVSKIQAERKPSNPGFSLSVP